MSWSTWSCRRLGTWCPPRRSTTRPRSACSTPNRPASTVGDERGAVLLAGAGGAGKTTTTVACLLDGLQFVGDNYVLLSQEAAPTVHGIYHNVKLRPGTLELLPELASAVNTHDVEE